MDDKLAGIETGRRLRVLDLFAGCGGLSLGFQRAGFEILGGVEQDPRAAWTYAANLHKQESDERREQLGRSRDISDWTPHELLEDLGCKDKSVDVIVGGPPCQAYARVGRAKLREVRDDPEAFRQDERGKLYLQYLRYVRDLRPIALLIENVPDILNYGGRNIVAEIAKNLNEIGYLVNFDLLNAANYGVPQMRRRLYLIAYSKGLGIAPGFPQPTHKITSLPSGYREFGALASKLRQKGPFCGTSFGDITEEIMPDLPDAVTAKEAVGDLPWLTTHLKGRLPTRRRFDVPLQYVCGPLCDFAQEMRNRWPGFVGGDSVYDHVIRLLPRDYRIFARMEPDDDYPKAHTIALDLFEMELKRQREAGNRLEEGSEEWENLKKLYVPPYDPTKFPNKWRKMNPDRPARTLLAHLSHDSYTHIHYDDTQARTISLREAARLQSFPDGFKFYEVMNSALKMIGNAVPPWIAFQVAQHMCSELRGAARELNCLAMAS